MDFSLKKLLLVPLGCAVILAAVVTLLLVAYRPDRPVATLVPGSSPEPAFVVQIIRPRLGLPLGGLLSPRFFGLEAHLGFDSASDGAVVRSVGPRRIELGADDWELILAVDDEGQATSETQVIFEFVFEEQRQRVRCRPADPAVGSLGVTGLPGGQLSGSFDIELARCEFADSGEPLGWPPKPLGLHGSFDRLPPSP